MGGRPGTWVVAALAGVASAHKLTMYKFVAAKLSYDDAR